MKEGYEFEWDDAKNASNAKKHGVTFSEATSIWDDPMFLEVVLTSDPEERRAVIGKVGKNDYLAAIITYRSETIRIISARKSTKKEVDAYA